MERIFRFGFNGLLVVICSFTFSLGAQSQIKIATGKYIPYTGKELNNLGYMNHIISAAFNEMGIEVEYEFIPWARALEKTRQGNYHGMSYGYYNQAGEKDYIYSDLIAKEYIYFYGKKGRVPTSYDALDELKGFRIGVTRAYTYNEQFWDLTNNAKHKLSVVNTDLQNMQMLVLERIDLFPVEELTAKHILAHHINAQQAALVHKVTPALQVIDTHLLVSRNVPNAEQLIKSFNLGLKKLGESGKLQQMRKNLLAGYYDQPDQ